MSILDFIAKQFADWLATPLPSFLALGIGIYFGYLFSGIRHQGKIDGLEERLKHRDEQIGLKDRTIESLNAATAQIQQVEEQVEKEHPTHQLPPPDDPELVSDANRNGFRAVNAELARQAEAHIRRAIRGTRYKFVFNPKTEQSKVVTFLEDGSIGEGRNNNENRWKIKNGLLEILDANGQLYSRFTLLQDKRSFHHTNEFLGSIRGQYLVPLEG